MSGHVGEEAGGNREVSSIFDPVTQAAISAARASRRTTQKERGSWGKHGFPHASEQKASEEVA
jgi:hypothetical protein